MKSLLSNAEQRRLKLIETLYFFGNYEKKEKLLDILDCKETILRSDIEYVNNLYGDYMELQQMANFVMLNFKENISIDMLYSHILANSPIFSMVECILFHDINSIDDLANYLYTSPSTVYRMVDKFNIEASDKYDIYIDTKNMSFVGKEHDIRCFYVQFLTEKYSYANWPFQYDRDALYQLLKNVFDILHFDVNYATFEMAVVIAAVNIQRYKMGHKVEKFELNHLCEKDLADMERLISLHKDVAGPLSKLDLDSSDECIYNIFYPIMLSDYVYDFYYYVTKLDYNPNVSKSMRLVGSYVYKFVKENGIQNPDVYDFIVTFHNAALLSNLLVHSNHILYDRNWFYVERAKLRFSKEVDDVMEFIEDYLMTTKGYARNNDIYFLTYVFLTTWTEMIPQLYKKYKPLEILIVSSFNYQQALSMKDQFNFFFNNITRNHIYEEKILT